MDEQSILPVLHPDPFYGNPADVPERPVVFAGLEFKVPSSAVSNLPLFTRSNASGAHAQSVAITVPARVTFHHYRVGVVAILQTQVGDLAMTTSLHIATLSAR